MSKDHQIDVELESEPFLIKSSKRRDRLNKSTAARKHRERRKMKEEREYNDGFRGNYST